MTGAAVRSHPALFAAIFALGTKAPLNAQRVAASTHGPKGGEIGSLSVAARCPETSFFAGNYDILRSADGGASWAPTNLSSGVLAQDPWTPDVFYVTVEQGDRYLLAKTVDFGSTFTALGSQAALVDGCLAIDPFDSRVLYAGVPTFACYFGTCPPPTGGVFKSVDGGVSWIRTSHSAVGTPQILVDPWQPKTVYSLSARSDDGGASWTALAPPGGNVTTLSLLRTIPATLMAATDAGLYASQNGGRSWTLAGLAGVALRVIGAPSDASVLAAGTTDRGILRSTDGGVSWSPTDIDDASIDAVVFDPCDARRVVAVGVDRAWRNIFTSGDGGLHWSRHAELPAFIDSVVVDPGNASRLIAGDSYRGFYESLDGGSSWSPLRRVIEEFGGEIGRVTIDPTDPDRLFVPPFHRSDDDGATWRTMTINSDGSWISAIAVFPDGSLIVATGEGIYASSDHGDTWRWLSPYSTIQTLRIAPSDPAVVYATTFSVDDDRTTHSGIGSSNDGGGTWSLRPLDVDGIVALAVDHANASHMVVLADVSNETGSRVYESFDGGVHLDLVSRTDGYATSLAADPVQPERIYASSSGIEVSDDAGRHWRPLAGSGGRSIVDLAVAADGSALHGATQQGEVDFFFLKVAPAPAPSVPAVVSR